MPRKEPNSHCTESNARLARGGGDQPPHQEAEAHGPGDTGDAMGDRQGAGHLQHVVDLQVRRERASNQRTVRTATDHDGLACVGSLGHGW